MSVFGIVQDLHLLWGEKKAERGAQLLGYCGFQILAAAFGGCEAGES
jgi:hypothetical protein